MSWRMVHLCCLGMSIVTVCARAEDQTKRVQIAAPPKLKFTTTTNEAIPLDRLDVDVRDLEFQHALRQLMPPTTTKYSMLFVRPDPKVDYRILVVPRPMIGSNTRFTSSIPIRRCPRFSFRQRSSHHP